MNTFTDLHCDTLTKAFEENKSLIQNNLHIDFKKLNEFKSVTQVFAIWLDKKYYDKAFDMTNKVIDFFDSEIKESDIKVNKIANYDDINNRQINAILAIEGGESLQGNIDNIYHFYNRGVRFLTLCWNFENEIGFGARTNIDKGLKPFGKEVIKNLNKVGITIDVSHLNENGFKDVCKLSEKPFIATHSNSFNVYKHYRNLKDYQIKEIVNSNGIIGINLYPKFLTNDNATIFDVIKHIDYIINLVGDKNITLGCDLDGIDILPNDIYNVLDYKKIFRYIKEEFGDDVLNNIAYKNFNNFFRKV